MANTTKVRGITIELGADSSGIQKALREVNADLKTTQSQLKDVEKLLKLDPGNTELLAQKQKLLAKNVEETKSKLETLKEAQKQFAKEAENGNEKAQQAYDALAREIVSTTADLEKAQKAQNSFSITAEKSAAALGAVSSKATLVAEKTKALSTVAAAAGVAILGMGYKAATAADDLNTLASQTGFTTDELQKMQYASDLVDVSVDSMTKAAAKMKKNMVSTSSETVAAWQKVGVSVRDRNGELRSSTEVFYQTLEALSRVGNETERDTLAMQIFGRSADELAGIIDDGGEALRRYGEQAEAAGLILSQESLDAANNVNDMIDTLKADVNQTILVTGAKALEAMMPIIERVMEAISGLLDWIGSLDETTLGVITTIALMVGAISPVASLIGGITTALQGLVKVLPIVVNFIDGLNMKTVAIVAVLTVLVTLIIEMKNAWGDMTGFEKVISVLGAVAAAALTAAIAMGAFQSAATLGAAAAGIALGLGVIIASVEAAKARAEASAKQMQNSTKIPAFANGGSISSGSALVGEAGAELLTVSNGVATVTPLTNNYTTNNYTQASNQPIQVNVQLDRQTIAQAMYEPLNEYSNLRGGSLVKAR